VESHLRVENPDQAELKRRSYPAPSAVLAVQLLEDH
jgi:hypothetical protein